jgi:K+-transporting ATPase ATPase C chain
VRAQLSAGLRALLVFTVLCGLAYPLAVTGVAQLVFGVMADGSLVERDGRVVGSTFIGQRFEGDEWFHPRPSAAGEGYDGMASSASNLGPTNDVLLEAVADRVDVFRRVNGLDGDVDVPVDAVTSSGSGLDPHISVANARLQAARVAAARELTVEDVLRLVEAHTSQRLLGFLGEEAVNVLALNLALDRAGSGD